MTAAQMTLSGTFVFGNVFVALQILFICDLFYLDVCAGDLVLQRDVETCTGRWRWILIVT
jgi:hypothetical protein